MIILGIDPGTLCTGFGIIKFTNNQLFHVASGIIKPPAKKNITARLKTIYDQIDKVIKTYKPDEFSIETAFYGKNIQSALKIGYARGVSLLVASHNNLEPGEYSPREIKKSVVGNGAASKEQVQYMIKKLLALKSTKMKFDESDAVAVAICHAFKMNSIKKKSSTWKEFVESNPDRIIS
ncbi:MAG: crossover junction endodeoxyribonuclease RuvC [bacterium]